MTGEDASRFDAGVSEDITELPLDAPLPPDAILAQVYLLHEARWGGEAPRAAVSAGFIRINTRIPERCDAPIRMGACELLRCDYSALDGGPITVVPQYLPGGSVLIQGLTTDPLTLTPSARGLSSAALNFPAYRERIVAVTSTGDPAGMPAFRMSAPAPSMIALRSPSIERMTVPNVSVPIPAMRASPDSPLEFTWTGGGGDPVYISLLGSRGLLPSNDPFAFLRCSYPGSAGRASLLPEHLRIFREFPTVGVVVETGGPHSIAVGGHVARLHLTHYAANVWLLLR